MKITDLTKLKHILMPDVKLVKNMTFKDLLIWIIMVVVTLAAICFFIWFLIYVAHFKGDFSFGPT